MHAQGCSVVNTNDLPYQFSIMQANYYLEQNGTVLIYVVEVEAYIGNSLKAKME